jgi:site-specific DNA recombinase
VYRSKVADLHGALRDPDLITEATQIIRSLIDKIIVTDRPTGVEIELVGDLAMMVALGSDPERKKAALNGAALSLTEQRSVKVVAGAGFEPTTFRL